MSFLNENVAQGLPENATYQAGVSDVDNGQVAFEPQMPLPWVIDPEFTYLDHYCNLDTYLDSGIVTHSTLPQSDDPVDSLGIPIDTTYATNMKASGQFAKQTTGVNLRSRSRFTNIVQRMANSSYRFRLHGWACRVGYQIPIPRLITIAGVPAIPDDDPPQEGGNIIVGNLSGIPVYFARWSSWYTVAIPPQNDQAPPANLAEYIDPSTPLPKAGVPMPLSPPDSDAVANAPRRRQQGNIPVP